MECDVVDCCQSQSVPGLRVARVSFWDTRLRFEMVLPAKRWGMSTVRSRVLLRCSCGSRRARRCSCRNHGHAPAFASGSLLCSLLTFFVCLGSVCVARARIKKEKGTPLMAGCHTLSSAETQFSCNDFPCISPHNIENINQTTTLRAARVLPDSAMGDAQTPLTHVHGNTPRSSAQECRRAPQSAVEE